MQESTWYLGIGGLQYRIGHPTFSDVSESRMGHPTFSDAYDVDFFCI